VYESEIIGAPFLKRGGVFFLITYPLLDLSLSISYNATKKEFPKKSTRLRKGREVEEVFLLFFVDRLSKRGAR
jgi:hypothetical protein